MCESRERNPFSLNTLYDDSKEAIDRIKELWGWTRIHPKSGRNDLQKAIVESYKSVLFRWFFQLSILFILVLIIRAFWEFWGWFINLVLNSIF